MSQNEAKQVLDNCVGCGSLNVEDCESFQSGLITDCLPAIAPTNGELVLSVGAGQKAIERLRQKIRVTMSEYTQKLDCTK